MAAILTLEDGTKFQASSLGFGGLLSLISDAIDNQHSRLRAWLADKGNRPSPFQDFDIRALTQEDRAVFWAASERALSLLVSTRGPLASWPPNAYSALALSQLVGAHRNVSASSTSVADCKAIDLDELWGSA